MRHSKLSRFVAPTAGALFMISAFGAVALARLGVDGQAALAALQTGLQFTASATLLLFGAAVTDWRPQEA